MRRFVEGIDREQATLFPEYLEDWIDRDNPARAIDVFVDELVLAQVGFGGVDPRVTRRPSYHPSALLKLYIYGYLNHVQSSRRLAASNLLVTFVMAFLYPESDRSGGKRLLLLIQLWSGHPPPNGGTSLSARSLHHSKPRLK